MVAMLGRYASSDRISTVTKQASGTTWRTVWPWLAFAAAAATVASLLLSPAFKTFVDEATRGTERIMSAHPVLGALVFFVFSAVSAMLAFASSAVLVPSANLAWGEAVTFLLLWTGWLAGAVAAFGIGRLAGPLLRKLGHQKALETYRQFSSRRMKFWMVLAVCFAVPSEIPGYLFGSAHYPFLKFLIAMSIAEAAYALGMVLAGHSLTAAEPGYLLLAASAMAVAGVGAALLLQAVRKRTARRR